MAKQKFYVVLKGIQPGIYDSWAEAEAQVKGFEGAVYRSFENLSDARNAWEKKMFPRQNKSSDNRTAKVRTFPTGNFLVVDAACSGTPGPTEYRGFLFPQKKLVFHLHIGLANNNIGEFLAIVHAQAWMAKIGYRLPVYSDSITAISWVKNKKVKSELPKNRETKNAWDLVDRALVWLHQNNLPGPVIKWKTEFWGENPADFGRK